MRWKRWLDSRPARLLRAHWLEAVAVISIVGLVIGVSPTRLASAYRHLQARVLLLMLGVVLAQYLTRGAAWWVTLRHIGVRISLWRTELAELAGQVLIFVPTGDLARAALAEEHAEGGNRKPGQLLGSIAFQELLFLTVLGLGVVPKILHEPGLALTALLITVSQLGILGLIVWKPAYDWSLSHVERIRLLRRFDKQLRNLRVAFVELLDPRVLAAVLVCDAVAAALSYLLFWIALRSVGVEHVSYVTAAFVLSLSHIVSALSFIPGSAGAFEGLVILLMLSNGVAPGEGAAAGLLYRGFNDIVMAGFGVLAGAGLRAAKARRTTRRRRARSRRTT